MDIKKQIVGDIGVIKFLGTTLGEAADSKIFENR